MNIPKNASGTAMISTSITTSDLGLSRSCTSFSASATASAEPLTTNAFCGFTVNTRVMLVMVRTAVEIS